MDRIGRSIIQEYLTTVGLTSIIVFFWLALTLPESGRSRIHGDTHGVRMDISDWPQEILVASVIMRDFSLNLIDFYKNSNFIFLSKLYRTFLLKNK
jgi:hypothetical protein